MTPLSPQIVAALNALIPNELLAAEQYRRNAKQAEFLGYAKLAAQLTSDAAEEQGHADALSQRVRLLGGVPTLAHPAPKDCPGVPEMLAAGLALELANRLAYLPALAEAQRGNDAVTWGLLRELQEANEEGVEFYERQKRLVEQMGIQNYLAGQV